MDLPRARAACPAGRARCRWRGSPPAAARPPATLVMPMEASRPISAGPRRAPRGMTTSPGATSSAARRTLAPGCGASPHLEQVAGLRRVLDLHHRVGPGRQRGAGHDLGRLAGSQLGRRTSGRRGCRRPRGTRGGRRPALRRAPRSRPWPSCRTRAPARVRRCRPRLRGRASPAAAPPGRAVGAPPRGRRRGLRGCRSRCSPGVQGMCSHFCLRILVNPAGLPVRFISQTGKRPRSRTWTEVTDRAAPTWTSRARASAACWCSATWWTSAPTRSAPRTSPTASSGTLWSSRPRHRATTLNSSEAGGHAGHVDDAVARPGSHGRAAAPAPPRSPSPSATADDAPPARGHAPSDPPPAERHGQHEGEDRVLHEVPERGHEVLARTHRRGSGLVRRDHAEHDDARAPRRRPQHPPGARSPHHAAAARARQRPPKVSPRSRRAPPPRRRGGRWRRRGAATLLPSPRQAVGRQRARARAGSRGRSA